MTSRPGLADRTHLAELMIDKLRVWNPDFSPSDLDKPLSDLDVDSLDRLEVVHLLEKERGVMVDLTETMKFKTFREHIDFFLSLEPEVDGVALA